MSSSIYIKLYRPSGVPVDEGCEVSVITQGFLGGVGKFKTGRGGTVEMRRDVYGGKTVKVYCNGKRNERWVSKQDEYLSNHASDAIPIDLTDQ